MTARTVSRPLRGCFAALLLAVGLQAASPVFAHKGSDAYLDVQQTNAAEVPAGSPAQPAMRSLRFQLSVAIRDLDLVVPIDANADAQVTWGEAKAAVPQVLSLLDETATLDAPATPECALHWKDSGLERRGDGVYMRVESTAQCPADRPLVLNYALLKDQDATHRLLVAGRIDGADLLSTVSAVQGRLVLAPAQAGGSPGTATAAAATPTGRWVALRNYFSLGLHHLLEGYDHLAFLLALVLPLQLSLWPRRRGIVAPAGAADISARPETVPGNGRSVETSRFRASWIALLRTITAFTIGHSITLMLATFGVTDASPAWVEPVIALSIAVTALLNLRPVGWIRIDVLALLFGLVHGFGFAGLLKEAAAPDGLLPWALAGFNLGVEAGQLTAVAGWVLLSQFVVAKPWYRSVVVRGGSVLLCLLALWWFWQRVA
ncbi:MAG: hypothetical protein EOO28_00185 [Comamonadaceae bacterium]|nr:MAG: hypothetical protein EOO28_00185 [Comamonadaceae bacterium]